MSMRMFALGLTLWLTACASSGLRAEPLDKEFEQRAAFYIEQLAAQDADKTMDWAKRVWPAPGGGDPHKYVLPVIIAEIALDPTDQSALNAYRRLMVVDKNKGDRGLYHFAAYLRARLYCQFRDKLPKDVVASNAYDAKHFYHIMTRGGTENHGFMHRTSAYVFSQYVKNPATREGRDPRWVRNWLIGQAKRWYNIGTGEYDSSTYYPFTTGGWSNVYDFAEDPAMRDTGRAALDWLSVAMANKYFHGCYLCPEARGFAKEAVGAVKRDEPAKTKSGVEFQYATEGTHTDWLNWLWFGGSVKPMHMDSGSVAVDEHAIVTLALSKYRPHRIVHNIATKNVKLPYEARGSHPQYYGGPDDDGNFPGGNKDQDYLYFADEFAMGTLYSSERGVRVSGTILPQTTMFKVLLKDTDDVRVFGASNGFHGHFPLEGRSPFDQYHQKRDAAINVCYVNPKVLDNDPQQRARLKDRSILGMSQAVGKPVEEGGWYFWQVNRAFIAARPLNGKAAWQSDEQVMHKTPKRPSGFRWLVSPGSLGGWVIQLGQQPQYQSLQAFRRAVLDNCKLDLSDFNEQERTVRFTNLHGDELKLRHTGGPGGKPDAWTNGKALIYKDWPVFESPYIKQEAGSGILQVNDGNEMLTIDFTGDRPRYTESDVSK